MGASAKGIKSLVGQKEPSAEKAGSKWRKWSRLFRSSSPASRAAAPAAEASSASADAFGSLVAAVVRAPPSDFRHIRQECAAVLSQAAFRCFLARRALKALRGIVRLQALVRGRLVRRQLAVTFEYMNALLRVQERARERRARSSADGRGSHDSLAERNGRASSPKDAEEQWCDRDGSVDEIRSKLQIRHEGAAKRERAIAYSLSHQRRGSKHSGKPGSPTLCRSHDSNMCNQNLSYLEGWMATKPWEIRLMEQNQTDSQFAKNCEELNLAVSKLPDASLVKIRRNNVTSRVAAKPPVLSASSSDFVCDESSPSTSSVTPASAANILASEARSDSGHVGRPNYMDLTKSAKARLNGCSNHRESLQIQRQRSGDMPRMALSSIDTQSNAGSEISVTSKRLNGMYLKGRSMTRRLDKENEDRSWVHVIGSLYISSNHVPGLVFVVHIQSKFNSSLLLLITYVFSFENGDL